MSNFKRKDDFFVTPELPDEVRDRNFAEGSPSREELEPLFQEIGRNHESFIRDIRAIDAEFQSLRMAVQTQAFQIDALTKLCVKKGVMSFEDIAEVIKATGDEVIRMNRIAEAQAIQVNPESVN